MNALSRPLEHVLPARAATRLIVARRAVLVRLARAQARVARAWRAVQPWLAGAALVLAWSTACSWLDARDRAVLLDRERVHARALERQNTGLRGALAQANLSGDHNVFYVLEGASISEVAGKMERLSKSIAGDTYRLEVASSPAKGRRP